MVPAYVLAIVGADLILGASWLAQLGPHVVDYEKKTIHFYHNNQFMVLQGALMAKPAYTTVPQLNRLCSTQSIRECYSLQIIPVDALNSPVANTAPQLTSEIQSVITADTPDELFALLNKFHFVFAVPRGLPPSRACDHRIPLLPDSTPVKVKPYQYPHSQKEEIDKMVQQMLADGLIAHSTSPF